MQKHRAGHMHLLALLGKIVKPKTKGGWLGLTD